MENYKELLKSKNINLVEKKYCDLDSWDMCLIHIELNGNQKTFVIEKYQNFYGSIKWNSIFSENKEKLNMEEKNEIMKIIHKKYPNILLNENIYSEPFKEAWKETNYDRNYYKNTYNQEVEMISSSLEWLELSRILKIRD